MEGISEEVSSDSFCENILSFLLVVLNVLEFARHSIWYFYDSLYSERKMMDLWIYQARVRTRSKAGSPLGPPLPQQVRFSRGVAATSG